MRHCTPPTRSAESNELFDHETQQMLGNGNVLLAIQTDHTQFICNNVSKQNALSSRQQRCVFLICPKSNVALSYKTFFHVSDWTIALWRGWWWWWCDTFIDLDEMVEHQCEYSLFVLERDVGNLGASLSVRHVLKALF